MMQHAIDRSVHTGGSFATSVGVHVALLLLLAVLVGREAAERLGNDELTEIAYIEAHYGEDVAEKVKLKALRPAGAPGPGISTDSAVKRPEPAVAEAASPELAPKPQLEPKRAPAPTPKLQPQAAPRQRPELAAAAAPDLAPATTPRRELAAAAQLDGRTAPAPKTRIIDTEKLAKSLAGDVADAAPAPARAPRSSARETFAPSSGGLRDRGGRAPVGSDPVVTAAATSRRATGEVAGADAALGGGGLSQRESPARASGPSRPALARGSAGTGGGIVDVDAPAGGGGGARSTRSTILDYGDGSGGGGGSGSLAGRRGRLAEPAAPRDIVAEATAPAEEPAARVAEAELENGEGVGMTISGQIAGRKILHRAAPAYSDRARQNGWEGVVAVHFTVLADGRVKDNLYFEQTSVHRDLNQAAMAAIRQFRFAPLPTGQAAREQWGVITIVFRLH